jgi:hypothetical protein
MTTDGTDITLSNGQKLSIKTDGKKLDVSFFTKQVVIMTPTEAKHVGESLIKYATRKS